MLEKYPALTAVVQLIEQHLRTFYPEYFGKTAKHPVLPLKRSKVLHDNLWGTNRFSWRELAFIDSPLLQRLRDIHQVGLAFQTYMCACHTRFEHSIGVVAIASRVFDALLRRDGGTIKSIIRSIDGQSSEEQAVLRLKEEMRLAALLHDVGHSLYSHTSERVYSRIPILEKASEELSLFVGKEKGAGEVLAFCMALSGPVAELLERAGRNVIGDVSADDYKGEISLTNVALMIVGRGSHPFLQFLADIISSGFDADKLDYLYRDAASAGLPLRYDLDRYLYSVRLEKGILVDGEDELQALYDAVWPGVKREGATPDTKFPFYETYRLRLPREAMNTIEQIVLCKLMLFSYIYHHQKVRAAEGLLEKMLARAVEVWRDQGKPDEYILERFLAASDSSLHVGFHESLLDPIIGEYSSRIVNRLLPREVYGIGGADASHAEGALLESFLIDLQKRERRDVLIREIEEGIGEELRRSDPRLADLSWHEALLTAGVWFDVPKLPKIEDVQELVVADARHGKKGIALTRVFPVGEWTEAYTHFKYQVRVFAFSEYCEAAASAARKALEHTTKITVPQFYNEIRRRRA